MKAFIAKHGTTVGGLFGLATAWTLYFGYKPVGLTLAIIAVTLVITSERMRAHQVEQAGE